MQSFKAASSNPELFSQSPFFFRRDNSNQNQTHFQDLGELEQSASAFPHDDAVDLSPSSIFSLKSSNVGFVPNNLQYSTLTTDFAGSLDIIASTTRTGCVNTGEEFMYEKGTSVIKALGNGHLKNWGDSVLPDNSQQTDTSTDVDTDDKNQFHGAHIMMVSMEQGDKKKTSSDQKILRRLAQNREAAKKSRLRKKAYVQQLENSRLRLSELEQELQRARQQGAFNALGFSGGHNDLMAGNGGLAFNLEYVRWLDEHQRLINDLRSAIKLQMGDKELRILVESVMALYDEIFRIKTIGAKADVFHMLFGMWKTPVERCFMWLGGFRSSEVLKILGNHLESLTNQQLMGICNLQQSSQEAEDALSQGMEALQQSLVETLSSSALGPSDSRTVADFMGQMVIATGKLATLESFLHQADLLRLHTLQQMHRILTTQQAARALLVISDYFSRLRALSSLWLARPRDWDGKYQSVLVDWWLSKGQWRLYSFGQKNTLVA